MPVYDFKNYIKVVRPVPKNWPKGMFGIPFIKKSNVDLSLMNTKIKLVSLSNVSAKDKHAKDKIVQPFKFDCDLERFYKNPVKFLPILTRYYAVSTLDFSMHKNMEVAQIINATFMNRWSGAFLQMNGYPYVIVTVGWVTSETYDICFSGIEDGTVLMISTLGVNNDRCRTDFLSGYYEMRKRFPHSTIICVGDRLDEMDKDVCYIRYEDSFGYKDLDYWQPSFLDWKSEVKEVL